MKFRTGLIVGLGIGYVLGAKAGRQRYEQIMSASARLRSNDGVKKASEIADRSTRKPRAVAGDGLVKASGAIRTKVSPPPS